MFISFYAIGGLIYNFAVSLHLIKSSNLQAGLISWHYIDFHLFILITLFVAPYVAFLG